MGKKNVVILGAGFGGLGAAMAIAKDLNSLKLLDAYEVILIDRNDCHLFTPLLYKLAAGADPVAPSSCTYDISTLIKGLSIRFVQKEIGAIDLVNGDIHLKTGEEIKADFLVIALGSETNFFGIPGLKEHSLELKRADDALLIRRSLEALRAKGGTKVVIGGAGANGIELAAEIMTTHKGSFSVTLVEAMPNILPGLHPRVEAIAAKRLRELGVTVMTNEKIVNVSDGVVTFEDTKTLPFDLFVWTGGIKSPGMLSMLELKKDQRGRPMSEDTMVCLPATPDLKLYPMIYGIGDSVCFMNPKTNRPVPAVARAAILQSRIAAHNIIEEIKAAQDPSHHPELLTYKPTEYPYVIPIGDGWATAKIGPLVVAGSFGWAFSKLVEIHYLTSIMSLGQALFAWRQMPS